MEFSNVAKAHLLRILIIGRVQQKKHVRSIKDLKSKLAKVPETIIQRQETVKILAQEKDNLKILLKRWL